MARCTCVFNEKSAAFAWTNNAAFLCESQFFRLRCRFVGEQHQLSTSKALPCDRPTLIAGCWDSGFRRAAWNLDPGHPGTVSDPRHCLLLLVKV